MGVGDCQHVHTTDSRISVIHVCLPYFILILSAAAGVGRITRAFSVALFGRREHTAVSPQLGGDINAEFDISGLPDISCARRYVDCREDTTRRRVLQTQEC